MHIGLRQYAAIGTSVIAIAVVVVGIEHTMAGPPARALVVGTRLLDGTGPGPSFVEGPHVNQLFILEAGRPQGIRVPLESEQVPAEGALSPRGDLVALLLPVDTPDKRICRGSVRRITGTQLLSVDSTLQFAWSQSGERIAFILGSASGTEIPSVTGLRVVDLRLDRMWRLSEAPLSVDWAAEDSLVLDYGDHVGVLALPEGIVTATRLHGTDLSPDRRYSLSLRPEADIQVWDEVNGREVTGAIRRLFPGYEMRSIPRPFWRAGTGHLLVAPACDFGPAHGPGRRASICAVFVIDPSTMQLVKQIHERAVVEAADRSGVFVRSGVGVKFVAVPARE